MSESKPAKKFNINFMGRRVLIGGFAILYTVLAMVAIAVNGLNLGLDFTGGTQLEVGFEDAVDLADVRTALQQENFEGAVPVHFGSQSEVSIRFAGELGDIAVQRLNLQLAAYDLGPDKQLRITHSQQRNDEFQSQVNIGGEGISRADLETIEKDLRNLFPQQTFGRLESQFTETNELQVALQHNLAEAPKEPLVAALSAATGQQAELKSTSVVGAQVGDELFESAVKGGLLALGVIMVYIALRFQFKFAVGAVVALAHDVIFVLGMFALFQWNFDLTVFAAILAVIGYSLNDTIVISDRIRENFRKLRKGSPTEIINVSINETLGRTIITGLTTLLVLFCLYYFGGESVHYFSLALIIGIVIGTFSSVYIAANVMLVMNIAKEDLAVPVKEGADMDSVL